MYTLYSYSYSHLGNMGLRRITALLFVWFLIYLIERLWASEREIESIRACVPLLLHTLDLLKSALVSGQPLWFKLHVKHFNQSSFCCHVTQDGTSPEKTFGWEIQFYLKTFHLKTFYPRTNPFSIKRHSFLNVPITENDLATSTAITAPTSNPDSGAIWRLAPIFSVRVL